MIACPFGPCDGPVEALVEMPPPPGHHPGIPLPLDGRPPAGAAAGPITRIPVHTVIGEGSWFGQCAASLMSIPLTRAARKHLHDQASVYANAASARDQANPRPREGHVRGMVHTRCGTVHGLLGPCPLDTPVAGPLHGNDLPPGNVAQRVWEKVPCGKCGQWIVRVPTGWRHQRADGTEWFPIDGHPGRPRGDEEHVSAADLSVCTRPGCGRPIIRTTSGWEHRFGEQHDHQPAPPPGGIEACDYCGKAIRHRADASGWEHVDQTWSGFGSHEIRPRNRH
jgi:hypothetical protein